MVEQYSDKTYNSLQNNHGNLLSYKKKAIYNPPHRYAIVSRIM